jgi:hypothetical protein
MRMASADTLGWLVVPMAATALTSSTDVHQALPAIDDATVAIFAFHDQHGHPTAWPMTPYRDGGTAAVTSTLAFMQKTVSIRRDGRVALLAGGWHLTGHARVRADISGDEFAARFLEQELRKYPPTRDLVGIPLHRWLFSWYFGRVIMEFTPESARPVAGSDAATIISNDAAGFPVITPITPPDRTTKSFPVDPPAELADGPATVLMHVEASDTDLRQLHLYGRLRSGTFSVQRRAGSLDAAPTSGWWGTVRQQWEFHRRAREARRMIKRWE